jgi:serine/threonine-protein kinase CTR1
MGACLTPGHLAIVTEYMSRGDLHDLIHDESNKLSFFQKCLMTRDITAGMTWLHENNPPIIHRDLKPSNMLVC